MTIPLTIITPLCSGRCLLKSFVTGDGAMYDATYEWRRRRTPEAYEAVLTRVVEVMPPIPPQLRRVTEDTRLPMMEDGVFSPRLEAEQRRKEWAECMEKRS